MSEALQKIEPLPVAPSVEAMITLAIEKGASVDTIERLMAVRREVRAEAAKEAYDRALAEFQAECPTIHKTAKVMNKDKTVRYQYAPLDAIIHQVKGLLQKHGFSYTVNAVAEPTCVKAVCKLTHAYGHSDTSEFAVPIDKDAYMNPAQQVASALTFAKRYAFCNACGIMTGDADDDSLASQGDKDATKGQKGATKPPLKPEPAKSAPSAPKLPEPDEAARQRFIALLKPLGQAALDYAYEHGWLMCPTEDSPGEPLEVLSLALVPRTKRQASEILAEIRSKMDSGASEKSTGDLPNQSSEAPKSKPSAKSGQSKQESAHHAEEWYQFPMPFGKNAGTILGKLPKNYLYGLWKNYTVETEWKGKPIAKDEIEAGREFRVMLDHAGIHYRFDEPRGGDSPEGVYDPADDVAY